MKTINIAAMKLRKSLCVDFSNDIYLAHLTASGLDSQRLITCISPAINIIINKQNYPPTPGSETSNKNQCQLSKTSSLFTPTSSGLHSKRFIACRSPANSITTKTELTSKTQPFLEKDAATSPQCRSKRGYFGERSTKQTQPLS